MSIVAREMVSDVGSSQDAYDRLLAAHLLDLLFPTSRARVPSLSAHDNCQRHTCLTGQAGRSSHLDSLQLHVVN